MKTPFPLTLLQLCPAAWPLWPEQPNTIKAVRQGTGIANRTEGWGQLEDLAVTPQGLGAVQHGADGAHGALECWPRTGLQWLLLACLLPALRKGTGMNLNNKSTPA